MSQSASRPTSQKRKQAHEAEESSTCETTERCQKQRRTLEDKSDQMAANSFADNMTEPIVLWTQSIAFWTREQKWPKEFFDQDDATKNDFENDVWKESSYSDRSRSSYSLKTESDQKPRHIKRAPYQDPSYLDTLQSKGIFMFESEEGITKESEEILQKLLTTEQPVPENSLFRDDVFKLICQRLQRSNEHKVIRDILLLIVPSAERLALCGAKNLEGLIETTNQGWNHSIPITKPRPQPDYSVGFTREAFTDNQRKRLAPLIGDFSDSSYFKATSFLWFPFLACEVNCSTSLDIADRQNLHCMTVAVRGIVELFKLLKREAEVNREILAFSISHDYRTVRIYGHYPVINRSKTTFYRHPIRAFDFTELNGREKWTAYKFIRNLYDVWVPILFKRISSVIDEIPLGINFDISSQSEGQEDEEDYGLSDLAEWHAQPVERLKS